MKKIVFLLIAICLVFTACDIQLPEIKEQHTHSWDDGFFSVYPTCQTDGEKIYTCTVCYETKTEVVKASDQYHNWGNGELVSDPTCTEKGERLFTCSICSKTKTDEIPPLGHLWDEGKITTEATESEDGIITYTCKREGCGATKTETYHLHKWGSGTVIKKATCSIDGEIKYTCSVCNETKTETIPADGVSHSYSTEWYKNETHHWHLANCGHIIPMAESEGYAEHDYGDPVIKTPATCTTEGIREKTCKVCGYTVTESYTDAENHTYSELWSSDNDQHWHVTTCGHEATGIKENHTFDKGVETKAGNCTTDGEIKYSCTVCGYSYTEAVPKEEYHDIDSSTDTCKICHEVFYFQGSYEANVTKVSLRAAFYNKGLTELVVPSLVPNWNYSRWLASEALKAVPASTLEVLTISEGITTIAYQALQNHKNLHTVNLPSTLKTIEQEAFFNCTALKSITIPASVTFIGAQAFADCTALTDIYFGGTREQWNTLMAGAKWILSGTSATVHCSDD